MRGYINTKGILLMTSFQDKALEQAARQYNQFRENKDKSSHDQWLDPYSKPAAVDKQKADALISAVQEGREGDDLSFTTQPHSVSITPEEMNQHAKVDGLFQ